jgi:hypothetical protein
MACPYFIPVESHKQELWPNRDRLPLGDGFAGRCGAAATEFCCDDETLRSHCNLGYAECAHLPGDRVFDAVRFMIQSQSPEILRVLFACELGHQPALCGELRFDRSSKGWLEAPDPRLMRLADAAVRAWIGKHVENAGH